MGAADPGRAFVVRAMTPERPTDIHLDTSFLIHALVPRSPESDALRRWLGSGHALSICTLAWGEFLCGPLEVEVEVLAHRIARIHVPLGTGEAAEAARLFNATGRRRGSFADCIVAATAFTSEAALATSDRGDFEPFVQEGLELVK